MLDLSHDAVLPKPTLLSEYRPPDFLIDTVELNFTLGEEETLVELRLKLRRNPAADSPPGTPNPPLRLDGEELTLKSIALDGLPLSSAYFRIEPDGALVIPDAPDVFTLDIAAVIKPQLNTALSGLYTSGGNFCTQCEAEGFRRITWFLDRPDVWRDIGCDHRRQTRYPILLSNGNRRAARRPHDGRHSRPGSIRIPKPSYLFALVAGDLVALEDSFTTHVGPQGRAGDLGQARRRGQMRPRDGLAEGVDEVGRGHLRARI